MPKPLPVIDAMPSADCCPPLTDARLTAEQAEDLSLRLKALADPTRLRLLSLMLASPGLEACTCDLIEPLGVSQATVSFHLKKMTIAGVVRPDRRVGNFTYYRVVPETLAALATVLSPAVPA